MDDLNTSGIYVISSPSGKCYIGSAVNFRRRWNGHRTTLRRGVHHCKPLQRAHDKYGLDALRFEIVERCEPAQLLICEQRYIDSVPQAWRYNGRPVAQSNLGVKFGPMTPERKARQRAGLLGRVLSDETKALIGAAHKGRKHSEAARVNMSAAHQGRVHTEDQRAKISAARNTSGFIGVSLYKPTGKWVSYITRGEHRKTVGYFNTPELAARARKQYLDALAAAPSPAEIDWQGDTRPRSDAGRKGAKLTAEHRAKLSAAHKGKVMTTEHRAKLSEASRVAWARKREVSHVG